MPIISKRWCPGPDSNRHADFAAADFKSAASTDFATRAECKVTRRFARCRLSVVRVAMRSRDAWLLTTRAAARRQPTTDNALRAKEKRAPFYGRPSGVETSPYELTPSGLLGQSIEISTSSPMNFRRTRNKRRCHGSAAHLAGVADRIGRSYSPRGVGEERELDVLFNF